MAQVIIQLQVDPETRKKNIRIKYLSDDDALPMEHEEQHRRILDQLIEGGALKAAEVGEVIVEREEGTGVVEGERERESEPERAPEKRSG